MKFIIIFFIQVAILGMVEFHFTKFIDEFCTFQKGSDSKPAFGNNEKYPSTPDVQKNANSFFNNFQCSFHENSDVINEDEEKLEIGNRVFNESLQELQGLAELTDLKVNFLSELVSRGERQCYREIYWLNECLKSKKLGNGNQ
jgi:hypothetical protein